MNAPGRNAVADPSVLVHTTSIGCWPGGDHTVCIALTNDGLTVRTPGLTPDQADALATRLQAATAYFSNSELNVMKKVLSFRFNVLSYLASNYLKGH